MIRINNLEAVKRVFYSPPINGLLSLREGLPPKSLIGWRLKALTRPPDVLYWTLNGITPAQPESRPERPPRAKHPFSKFLLETR